MKQERRKASDTLKKRFGPVIVIVDHLRGTAESHGDLDRTSERQRDAASMWALDCLRDYGHEPEPREVARSLWGE